MILLGVQRGNSELGTQVEDVQVKDTLLQWEWVVGLPRAEFPSMP